MLPGLPGGALLIPRQQVLFTRINMSSVPRKQRTDALKLEIEQQAPFDDPAAWVIWHDTTALVWYWPRHSQPTAANALPEVPDTALWPPLAPGEGRWVESAEQSPEQSAEQSSTQSSEQSANKSAHKSPEQSADKSATKSPEQSLYLLQFNHPQRGWFEKRFTRPLPPQEASAWLQRHGASAAVAAAIAPTPEPALSTPLGASLHAPPSGLETRILPAAVALLVWVVVLYAVGIGRAGWEAGRAEAAAEGLRESVQNIIELRNRATVLQNELQSLGALRQPSQVQLAAVLAETLDLKQTDLLRWNYRNGRLEITWRHPDSAPDSTAESGSNSASESSSATDPDGTADTAPNSSPSSSPSTPPEATALIRTLEAHPAFSNVQAQVLADNVVELVLNVEAARP